MADSSLAVALGLLHQELEEIDSLKRLEQANAAHRSEIEALERDNAMAAAAAVADTKELVKHKAAVEAARKRLSEARRKKQEALDQAARVEATCKAALATLLDNSGEDAAKALEVAQRQAADVRTAAVGLRLARDALKKSGGTEYEQEKSKLEQSVAELEEAAAERAAARAAAAKKVDEISKHVAELSKKKADMELDMAFLRQLKETAEGEIHAQEKAISELKRAVDEQQAVIAQTAEDIKSLRVTAEQKAKSATEKLADLQQRKALAEAEAKALVAETEAVNNEADKAEAKAEAAEHEARLAVQAEAAAQREAKAKSDAVEALKKDDFVKKHASSLRQVKKDEKDLAHQQVLLQGACQALALLDSGSDALREATAAGDASYNELRLLLQGRCVSLDKAAQRDRFLKPAHAAFLLQLRAEAEKSLARAGLRALPGAAAEAIGPRTRTDGLGAGAGAGVGAKRGGTSLTDSSEARCGDEGAHKARAGSVDDDADDAMEIEAPPRSRTSQGNAAGGAGADANDIDDDSSDEAAPNEADDLELGTGRVAHIDSRPSSPSPAPPQRPSKSKVLPEAALSKAAREREHDAAVAAAAQQMAADALNDEATKEPSPDAAEWARMAFKHYREADADVPTPPVSAVKAPRGEGEGDGDGDGKGGGKGSGGAASASSGALGRDDDEGRATATTVVTSGACENTGRVLLAGCRVAYAEAMAALKGKDGLEESAAKISKNVMTACKVLGQIRIGELNASIGALKLQRDRLKVGGAGAGAGAAGCGANEEELAAALNEANEKASRRLDEADAELRAESARVAGALKKKTDALEVSRRANERAAAELEALRRGTCRGAAAEAEAEADSEDADTQAVTPAPAAAVSSKRGRGGS